MYIGECIVLKVFIINKIDKDGKLIIFECLIYCRNIFIIIVYKEEIECFSIVGIFRERSNSVYEVIIILCNI